MSVTLPLLNAKIVPPLAVPVTKLPETGELRLTEDIVCEEDDLRRFLETGGSFDGTFRVETHGDGVYKVEISAISRGEHMGLGLLAICDTAAEAEAVMAALDLSGLSNRIAQVLGR